MLYADEVELVSPGAEMLGSMASLAMGDESGLLDLFLSMDDATISALGGHRLPPNWREMVRVMSMLDEEDWGNISELTGVEIPEEVRDSGSGMQNLLGDALDELRQTTDQMMEASGAAEIVPAIESGIVTLTPTVISPAGETDAEEMVRRYVEKLKALLADSRVHLLLDETMASLVRSLIEEGHVEPNRLALVNAGEAAVGSGLIARLPAFPSAPTDELLDLRRDLDEPLSRYRRSTALLAGKLRVGPFDAELQADIDSLYRSEVDPALVDLREGFAEHGLVREAAVQLATDVRTVAAATAGPVVSLGATSLADLNGWIQIASTAAPALGAGAQATVTAMIEQHRNRQNLETHDLYYLFEVERRSSRE